MASSTRFGVEAATSQPQIAATGTFTDELTEAIGRGVKHLLSLQASEGFWLGELEADTTLESDYIFYLHILDKADPQRISKLANYIRRRQLPDGGWNIYFDGPSELNATVKAYFALKLAGDRPDQAHMKRARARVLQLGGLEATNSYTRFYLALVGAVVWEMVPAIPPELMLLPSWFSINIYEMSSWTRGIVIPLAILYAHKPDWKLREPVRVDELFRDPTAKATAFAWGDRFFSWRNFFLALDRALKLYERVPWKPLRQHALRQAQRWLLEHLERSDGLGAIYPAMMNAVFALVALGYSPDDPLTAREIGQLARYEIEDGIALLHRAVAFESDAGKQAELWVEIGRANALRFDGEAFRAAIEQAVELTGPSAELYSELALQTARRSGMWKRPPDREVVDEWIDRALELAEEDSPTNARALAAVALWRKDEAAARSLHAIAQRLGDVDLRSNALAALTDVAWSAGDLEQARTWLEERLELLPSLVDPDDRHFALMTAVSLRLAAGRLSEASRASELLDEMVQGLTPHHRLHGMHARLLIEMIGGRWDDLRALTPQAERAVEANSAAPCPSNASCLLYCALASLQCEHEVEAARLEAEAELQILDPYRSFYSGPKFRLALARDDLSTVERLVDSVDFAPRAGIRVAGVDRVRLDDGAAAFLDALIALGARERIESEAPHWVNSQTYVQPFALRALGMARADDRLLDEATTRFRAIGLDWRADETLNLQKHARKGRH